MKELRRIDLCTTGLTELQLDELFSSVPIHVEDADIVVAKKQLNSVVKTFAVAQSQFLAPKPSELKKEVATMVRDIERLAERYGGMTSDAQRAMSTTFIDNLCDEKSPP